MPYFQIFLLNQKKIKSVLLWMGSCNICSANTAPAGFRQRTKFCC